MMKNEKFAQHLLNTLTQMEYPTDRLIERLLLKTKLDRWPPSKTIRFSNHAALTLSILSLKQTITNSTRMDILNFLNSKLNLVECYQSDDYTDGRAILETLSNVLTPAMLEMADEPIVKIAKRIISLVRKCRSNKQVIADGIHSVRHILEQVEVRGGLLELIMVGDCFERNLVLEALVNLPDTMVPGAVSALARQRSWPRHNFNEIDYYLLESIYDPKQQALNCDQTMLKMFFDEKSKAAWKLFAISRKRRQRRQSPIDELPPPTEAPPDDSSDPLALLSGDGLSGLSPEFTPELNCRYWDSQIGVYFSPEVYENIGHFDHDSLRFDFKKQHCLFK